MATSERAANSIPIERFKAGEDDFDEWVDLLEEAVKLATNPQTEERKHALLLDWLPLKLDDEARAIYKQCGGVTWPERKAAMKELMIDPQEVYKWKAKVGKITWDGKESFHRLATRVKRAVDKFDKDMNDESKANEYFFRFREALPTNYKNAIDMGCSADERTLERAKELALRLQMTAGSTDDRSVSFVGATMSEDRLKTLEFSMTKMANQLGNIETTLSKDKKESRGDSPNRERFEKRYSREGQRERNYSTDSGRSDSRPRSKEPYGFDRRRARYDSSPDRRSYSRGRYQGRYDDQRGRDRRGWGNRSSSGSYSRERGKDNVRDNQNRPNYQDRQSYRDRPNYRDGQDYRNRRDNRDNRNNRDRRGSREGNSRSNYKPIEDKSRAESRESYRSSQSDVSLDTDAEFEEFRAKKRAKSSKGKEEGKN